MAYLIIKNLFKNYNDGIHSYEALKNINLSFEKGEFVAIIGESGCGKSTLLNLIAAIHQPTKGEIILDNKKLSSYTKKQLTKLRREEMGILFQEFNLLDNLKVLSNLKLILNEDDEKKLIEDNLNKVQLEKRVNSIVNQLSGGQKQRIALTRCLINQPSLILCDEPTGALDSHNALTIMQLIKELGKNSLIICVSHDLDLVKQFANRIIHLHDGKVISDEIITPFSLSKRKVKKRNNNLKWFKRIHYCIINIIQKKGRFFISVLASSLAIIFLYLGLGLQRGVKNYLDYLFMSSYDAAVIDLVNYQKIAGKSIEVPIDYNLLQSLKNDNNYVMRPNLNDFLNDYFAPSTTFSFGFHKRRINNAKFKTGSSFFEEKNLLCGRLPVINRHYEVIVNEAFIKELQYIEAINKSTNQYLNSQLNCKNEFSLYHLGNTLKYIFNIELTIVGITKDTIFSKDALLYFPYQATLNYLENTYIENNSILDILQIKKYQLDIKNSNEIINVVDKLKKSKFYLPIDKINNNYRFSLQYNTALEDYLTFYSLSESLKVIIYFFAILTVIITLVLTSNIIYSIIEEIMHDLAIMNIIGIPHSNLFSFSFLFSLFIHLFTFLIATSSAYLLQKLNPLLNKLLNTKKILYLDVFSDYLIIMQVSMFILIMTFIALIIPLKKIYTMKIGEVLKQ